jgi:hypothetical protein
MPLHAAATAAAFLPSEIFEKGLEPPLWNSVWQLLFAGVFLFLLTKQAKGENECIGEPLYMELSMNAKELPNSAAYA